MNVDKIRQHATAEIEESPNKVGFDDTEIALTLPIIDEVRDSLDKQGIIDFCKKYPIFSADITFRFEVTDTSTPPRSIVVTNGGEEEEERMRSYSEFLKLEEEKEIS